MSYQQNPPLSVLAVRPRTKAPPPFSIQIPTPLPPTRPTTAIFQIPNVPTIFKPSSPNIILPSGTKVVPYYETKHSFIHKKIPNPISTSYLTVRSLNIGG